jgi:tetratricopeptide (TPR) repeat protein
LSAFLEHDPDNLRLIADAAEAALDEGDLRACEALLARYARHAPLTPALRNLAGLAALRNADFQAAAETFRDLLSAAPDDPALRFNLAWCLAMLKDYAGASEQLDERAAEANPQAARLKIQMLHHLGQLDEALALGPRLAERVGAEPPLMGALAAAAMDAGDLGLAARYAQSGGEDAEALATAGLLRLNEDRLEEGLKLFDRALASQPDDARALMGKGLALLAKGDRAAAPAFLDRGAERFGRHLGSWVAAGWAYFVNGDYQTSRARFETALSIDDTFAETHGALAVLDIVEGKLESGRRRADVAQRLDRNSFGGALARSLLLSAGGDPAAARRVIDLAMNVPIGSGGRTLAQALAGLSASGRT